MISSQLSVCLATVFAGVSMSTIIQKEIMQIVNCSFCILMQNTMCVVEGKGWGGEGGG